MGVLDSHLVMTPHIFFLAFDRGYEIRLGLRNNTVIPRYVDP